MRILAGDLGGTKTLLELSEVEHGQTRLIAERRYNSSDHAGFEEIIMDFFARNPGPVDAACIGVAGPVDITTSGESARITNLPWQLDSRSLSSRCGISRFSLINDFAAVAYGLEGLGSDEFVSLQDREMNPAGVRLVLGAGTGLGVAIMVHDGSRYQVLPTESGHAGFAPGSRYELEIFNYLQQELGYVSIEHVLSGPGLVNVYRTLHHIEHGHEKSLRAILNSADPGASISAAAANGDIIADRSLDVFSAIYGNVTGNLALTCLPFGGIFIAGGIAPEIITRLQSDTFLEAFHAKGKMSALMQHFSIKVSMNSRIGLVGARLKAIDLLLK